VLRLSRVRLSGNNFQDLHDLYEYRLIIRVQRRRREPRGETFTLVETAESGTSQLTLRRSLFEELNDFDGKV